MRFLLLIYDDESGSDDATPEQFAAMEVRPVIDYAAFETAGEDAAAQA